jgi:hypothetical protein
MAAELNRQDIVDDDLMAAPMVLTKDFEKLLTVLKQVADVGKKVNDNFGGKTPFGKAKEDTEELTKAQQELIKVQNAIATAVARENEEYITYKKQLQEVNQRIKEKTALGERDAKTINKQNAAIEELGAALRKNQQAYSKLRTEEERTSKSGKELLKIIQQQDKEFKELRQSMGIHTDEVGNYTKATEGLDGVLGGVIGRVKTLGSQLLALASNPFILMLSALVGLFAALASSVKTFFAATGEGEDVLARQEAVWNQFFATLKKGWADVGKSVVEFFGENGLQGLLYAIIATFSPKLAAEFAATATQAVKHADRMDALADRQIENIILIATTTRDYNKLILESQDEITYRDEERLKLLEAGIKLKEQQLKIDLQLAKEAADGLLIQIGLSHNLTEAQTRALTQTERYAKFTEEENRKLAESVAHIIDLEGQYYQEVKKNAAKIIKLKEEIRQKDVKEAEEAAMAEYRRVKKQVDERIKVIQQEVIDGIRTKKEGERDLHNYQLSMADDLIEAQINGLRKLWAYEELTAEERAEIDKRLYQLKLDLQKAYYDQIQDNKEVTIIPFENEIKFLEKLEREYAKFANYIGTLFTSLNDRRLQDLDIQQEKLEKNYERELEIVGENEVAKSELRNEFERKSREIELKRIQAQRRQAIFDKAVTAAQAAIHVAAEVIKQGVTTPLAIATGIAGAAMVAGILAKPIPQYEDGTDNHPGGLAIVGEVGSELMVSPAGQLSLTPDKATVMDLPSGTQVIPHDETMRMLALSAIMPQYNFDNTSADKELLRDLGRKLDSVERTIRNKREHITNLTRAGAQKIVKNAETRQYLINQLFR